MYSSAAAAAILLLFISSSSTTDNFNSESSSDYDSQTEFLLPYSETEDVDFNIARPGGSGCYQW
jgi:hypothetical protein